jgi:hypothetical protein
VFLDAGGEARPFGRDAGVPLLVQLHRWIVERRVGQPVDGVTTVDADDDGGVRQKVRVVVLVARPAAPVVRAALAVLRAALLPAASK